MFKLSGVGFINDKNEIDAVLNVEGESILLSEMQDSGMIANAGWFSKLIKSVVKAVVVAVVAVVAATVVATAGAAAPALVAAGVGIAGSAAWEHMQNIASGIWSAIKNIFLGIWEFIKGFCEGIGNFFGKLGVNIADIFKKAWEGIKGFFNNIWEGIKSVCTWIWDKITGLFSSIGDFFKNMFSDAFNWGKGLIENIWSGIQKAWNWVVDGVKGIGQSIKDFLGFGSPTKKGPGRTADEWIPNLLGMMEQDFYTGAPDIQRAAMSVAHSLNISATPRAMVGAGYNQNGDLINGLLQGMSAMNEGTESESGQIILNIDGQTFARMMMPKLNKEYRRNGIQLV